MFPVLLISRNEVLFEGKAESVFLPGDSGEFEILDFHHDILSLLAEGNIVIDEAIGVLDFSGATGAKIITTGFQTDLNIETADEGHLNLFTDFASTNTIKDVFDIFRRSTGIAGNGIGLNISCYCHNDNAEDVRAFKIEVDLWDSTDGSEDSSVTFFILNQGNETEVLYFDRSTFIVELDCFIEGFTQLGGSSAPRVKEKTITGTCATVGNATTVATGLTGTKIVSWETIVTDTDGNQMKRNYAGDITSLFWFHDFVNSSNNLAVITGASASRIAGQTFRTIIKYKE